MLARLCAFVLWALVAATVVFWSLRLFVRAPSAPAAAVTVGDATSTRVDLTRLLGAAPVAVAAVVVPTEVASRFRLLGIIAPRPSGTGREQGVALIAVDGKLPRAYQVGAAVDGEILLQSVSLRSAALGPARGGAGVTLELPPLPGAATGTLPTAYPVPVAAPVPIPAPLSAVPGLQQRIAAQALLPQNVPAPPSGALQLPGATAATGAVMPQPPPPRETDAGTQ